MLLFYTYALYTIYQLYTLTLFVIINLQDILIPIIWPYAYTPKTAFHSLFNAILDFVKHAYSDSGARLHATLLIDIISTYFP